MKNIYLMLLMVAMLVASCKSSEETVSSAKTVTKDAYKTSPYSTSKLVSHETQGLVTLRGFSDEMPTKAEAINNSQIKALKHMFYNGFPGTSMKNPMIAKGPGVESQNQTFFNQFYNSGYKQFITETKSEFEDCETNGKCVTATTTFTLNYNLLRREFEKNKVLNKIGF